MSNQNKIQLWILASRPKTLPAAFVPVLVGSSLAYNQGKFYPLYSLIALICSLLIQIGTNFTNDLYDYLRGADTEKRKGPLRVISAGMISPNEMKLAIVFVFGLTFLLGLYLVYVTDWKIFVIGVFSIIAGLAYTAGPFPLAYHGLGDLFVFLFFGIIGTMGTYYLHHQEFTFISFLVSLPVGALITNILIVNNYRDVEEDEQSGKNTLAVILGREFSRYEYIFFLLLAFFIPFILYFKFNFNVTVFLPYLTLPFAIILAKMIFSFQGLQLNKTLEVSAKYSAIYGILFSAGMII
ncbi:MAG: 1,4-dihydroxy-2-naphthoate polyprenyltransferase [Ignavibacterium sp.]|uniref:1,4-dihydroxy-2-naphthoate polyprenyltransferase n=1 Tax=Ignavibacterium sp. TaxID=2651167 RepID=UPI00404A32C5